MGNSHIPRLVASKETEIVGLADPTLESIDQRQTAHPTLNSVPDYRDHREMLEKTKPDAVAIASPHTLHMEHAMDSFAADCHVLLEKPMVTSVREARELLSKRDESGKLLIVSYQRHYLPAYRYVAEAIGRGEIGDVEYVAGLQSQSWVQQTAGSWRQDPRFSGGGQLIDSGSHLIDIIMYAINEEVAGVLAYQTNLGTPVNVNSAISIRFQNGALGTISVVGHGPDGMGEDISFYGSKGTILLRTPTFKAGQGQETIVTHENHKTGPVDIRFPEESTPDQNFIDAIRGKAKILAPGESGLRVIQVTEAATRSASSGREEVPD